MPRSNCCWGEQPFGGRCLHRPNLLGPSTSHDPKSPIGQVQWACTRTNGFVMQRLGYSPQQCGCRCTRNTCHNMLSAVTHAQSSFAEQIPPFWQLDTAPEGCKCLGLGWRRGRVVSDGKAGIQRKQLCQELYRDRFRIKTLQRTAHIHALNAQVSARCILKPNKCFSH